MIAMWRVRNMHNSTFPFTPLAFHRFPKDKIRIGNYTYGNINAYEFQSDDEKLVIGNFCSIAPDCLFLLGGGHNYRKFTTFPLETTFMRRSESKSNGPITVEDDVWIGEHCLILSGITLSQGTVVAAGSVVTKSTEPYSIVGGVPAKLIKYRFNENLRTKLMMIDFSAITADTYKNNRDKLSEEISEENIDVILKLLPLKQPK